MKWAYITLPILLAACTGGATPQPNTPATAADFPDVNVQAIADCVRANANEDELALLNQGGAQAEAATMQILRKPSTGQCLSESDTGLERAS